MEISIKDISNFIDCKIINCNNFDLMINSISIDSRNILNNCLFVPIVGQNNDGHNFVIDIKDKIKASFWQIDHKPYPNDITLILVKDTISSLQELAKNYFKTLNCITIAITGSNGKTSCKDIMYSVLSKKYKTYKTIGNQNNEIGLPLTILSLNKDTEIAILEMGIENRYEMKLLSSMAPANYCVVTSIANAHLVNFDDLYDIARSKLEIIKYAKKDSILIFNADSNELLKEVDNLNLDNFRKIEFSFSDISNIKLNDYNLKFNCKYLLNKASINSISKVMILNALPSIILGIRLGIDEQTIINALKNINFSKMRNDIFKFKNSIIIDDSYKSNPESLMAGLETLKLFNDRYKIAVIADMLDMGDKDIELHLNISKYANDLNIDLILAYGQLAKYFTHSNSNYKHFNTKIDLFNYLKPYLDINSVVLIKGSRYMKMDEIVNMIKEFKNEN